MRVLVACEESQIVTSAFRAVGDEAYSCDIQPCSGGHNEWHICGDVLPILSHPRFHTCDGVFHSFSSWDLIIAHPPCTYLTKACSHLYVVSRYGQKAIQRSLYREAAVDFFKVFYYCDCPRVAIENPPGYLSTHGFPPHQLIYPYWFGDSFNKPICLWLKGLPSLVPTNIVDKEPMFRYVTKSGKLKSTSMLFYNSLHLSPSDRSRMRSKFYPGIAAAMAQQWSASPYGEIPIDFEVANG